MTKKRWKVLPPDPGAQSALCARLGIRPLTAQLLINRGLAEPDRASSFLKPDINHLHDPFLLKDMDRAVERIVSAIAKREKIAVYGDYDVDGTTSAAMLHLFFRELGVDAACHIPDRLT